ncbi:hypothetical protein [Yeosuana marina]|uniref:hypothetical protein n=1 Tax=Yeosuana marina TaxID=1565536 RepID=UPI00141F7DEC|nr:hypothetical protein [Yeosuana marina]
MVDAFIYIALIALIFAVIYTRKILLKHYVKKLKKGINDYLSSFELRLINDFENYKKDFKIVKLNSNNEKETRISKSYIEANIIAGLNISKKMFLDNIEKKMLEGEFGGIYPKSKFYKEVRLVFKNNNEKDKLLFICLHFKESVIKTFVNYCFQNDKQKSNFSKGAEFIALHLFNINSIFSDYNYYPINDYRNMYQWKALRIENPSLSDKEFWKKLNYLVDLKNPHYQYPD